MNGKLTHCRDDHNQEKITMIQYVTFFLPRLMGSRSRAFRQEQVNTSKSLIGINFTENVFFLDVTLSSGVAVGPPDLVE